MAAPLQTLVTFLVETTEPAHSVELLGSWDNFSSPYQMRKDLQKGSRSWSGVFEYSHIICDGDPSQPVDARDGALLMGGTYWYYYKQNDHIEFHDPTKPSTSHCPLLPGQTVNILEIPVESTPTQDISPVCATENKIFTLTPEDRYRNPVPPAPRKRQRSASSLENAQRYFHRAGSQSIHNRSNLQTAPGDLQSVLTRTAFKYAHTVGLVKSGRTIKTSPAYLPPLVLSADNHGRSTEAPLMRSGTLENGRPETGSKEYEPFCVKPVDADNSLKSQPAHAPPDIYPDIYDEYRPSSWAGDTAPMDVGYYTRRAVSEPADYTFHTFTQQTDQTTAGQQEHGVSEEELDCEPKQTTLRDFDFGFATEGETAFPEPAAQSTVQFSPRPRLYSHDNVTAFRLSSLQTLFEDKTEGTPRQPDRTFSQDSCNWTTASVSSSAADSAYSSTYSCPTESVDSPSSLRYFGSSDQSGTESAEHTRPSSISLDFWLAPKEQQKPALPWSAKDPRRHELSTCLDLDHGKSTETLLPCKNGTTDPGITPTKLEHEAPPDLMQEMGYLGPLIF